MSPDDAQRSGLAGERAQRGLHGMEDGGGHQGGAKDRPRRIVNYLIDALDGDWVYIIEDELGAKLLVRVMGQIRVGSGPVGVMVRPHDASKATQMGERFCVEDARTMRATLTDPPTT